MITSPSNPLVKELVRLRSRRHRDTEARFVVEGRRPLALAAAAGVTFEQQMICRELGGEPVVDAPTVEMSEVAFRKASYRQNPEGVLAIARHLDTSLTKVSLPETPLVLVAESIEKPGNVGAMLRTADAGGVDAVVLTGEGTDIHNPNVVRASQGALFTVAVGTAAVEELTAWLSENGIRLLAAVPDGGSAPWQVDLTGPVALAIGAEDEGLSPALLDAAAGRITIPMLGRVDSLNASTAAAVLVYEAVRQRDSEPD